MDFKKLTWALPGLAFLSACGGELDDSTVEDVEVVSSQLNLSFAQHQTPAIPTRACSRVWSR